MIKYVLFDLDGTLTESAPGIFNSLRYAFKKLGLPEPEDSLLAKFVGPPLIESFTKYCGLTEAEALAAVDVYREYFAERGLFENAVYDGVPECLRRLRGAELSLAVATSKPEVYCRRILDHFGLSENFDVIKGIPLDGEDMTKAEVIAGVLAELGAEPGSAVMVGDRAYDVKGALENGIPCIGVLYGYGSAEELEAAGAAALAAAPKDLADAVLNM